MKYYIVWLSNRTDNRDDEVMKLKAKNKKEARKIAEEECADYRFDVSEVYTLPEFKKYDEWWHALIWGQRAINEPAKKKRRTK